MKAPPNVTTAGGLIALFDITVAGGSFCRLTMIPRLAILSMLLLSAGVGFCEDKSVPGSLSGSKTEEKADTKVPLKILAPGELDEILQHRLQGELGDEFRQFANMFFVRSAMDTGWNVGLSAGDAETAKRELQPVFPQFYQPTLRELLDTIALQTFSSWSYRKEDQFLSSKSAGKEEGDIKGNIIMMHFEKAERAKPYEVTLAKDWKSENRGHWTACIPPTIPMGMDIYEVGTYSAKEKAAEPALFERVRQAVALEWAQRVKAEAQESDLKPAKVGPLDALFFDAMIDARTGSKVRWRQWVFMAGNKCYFIVSTIFPESESTLYPQVEEMLKSFRVRKP